MITNSAKIFHGTEGYHKGPPLAWRVEEASPEREAWGEAEENLAKWVGRKMGLGRGLRKFQKKVAWLGDFRDSWETHSLCLLASGFPLVVFLLL